MDIDGFCSDCGREIEECECLPPETEKSVEVDSALDALIPHFSGLPKEALARIAGQAVKEMIRELRSQIKDGLRETLKRECGEQIKKLVNEEIGHTLTEILTTGIVYSGDSWEKRETTIMGLIQEQLSEAVKKLKDEYIKEKFVKSTVDTFIGKELTKLAEDAVREFKFEYSEEVKGESMKLLVKNIVGSIAQDKKLLMMLQAGI